MSASGQLTGLRFVDESAFGVANSSVFKALRFNDTSLNLKKETYQSNEIRSDRMKSDMRHGMRQVGGDISVELGVGTFDQLIEGALGGTFVAVTTGAVNLGTETGTNAITRAVGSFLDDGFLPGDEVTLTGFTTPGNNGRTKVLSVTATEMVVEKALATDAAAAGCTVELVGKRAAAGTELKTFQFERAFTDVGQYLLFSGCAVDQLKLSVKPGEIISATFTLLGKDMTVDVATAAASVTPAAANSPFDAFQGVLQEGGQTIAYVTGLDLTVSNGRSVKGVIGQQTAQEIFEGTCDVQGTLTAFFKDAAMLSKFLDEAESSIDVRLDDVNGTDFHRVRIPRVKYTGGDLDNPKEGPITLTLPFTGLLDAAAGTSIVYQRSNA